MNERIIELADKAVEDISSGPWNISDEFCKKFAELIINECIKIVDKNSKLDDNGMYSITLTINDIKERFGIEKII